MRHFTVISITLLGILTVAAPAQSEVVGKVVDRTSWQNIIPPTSKVSLTNWLQKKKYRQNFIAEPSIHTSIGPHGQVRIYYNPILAWDLHTQKTVFRKGAAMVKELYASDATTLTGYAVMVKTKKHATSVGTDWLYYQTMDGTTESAVIGKDLTMCSSCHKAGTDYLASDFRP